MNPPISGLRNVPMNSEQGKLAQQNNFAAGNMRRRRYSLELLNLAAQRSKEIGPKAASEETGVGLESIRKHMFVRGIENQNQGQLAIKRKAANGTRYTLEVKREVVRRSHELHQQTKIPIRKCYKSIGGLMGVNGPSIQAQHVRGLFTL